MQKKAKESTFHMKVTLISSHRDTTCKRKQKRVKEEVPSWRGVTHS